MGGFRTTLLFPGPSGGLLVPFEQFAATASFEYRPAERWTLAVAAGGVLGGTLGGARTGAGGVVSVAGSFLALEQGAFTPFVLVSASLAASLLTAPDSLYSGVDVRAGVAVGYTFFEKVTPYLTARAFGGPVFYRGQVGTDLFHYQVGLGMVAGLPGRVDVSVELVPFGEQRLTAGVGLSF